MDALFQFRKAISDWPPSGFSGPSGTHGWFCHEMVLYREERDT